MLSGEHIEQARECELWIEKVEDHIDECFLSFLISFVRRGRFLLKTDKDTKTW